MMKKSQEIWVKSYKPGKFRVQFKHSPGKWFVVRASSVAEARSVARTQERYLIYKAVHQVTFSEFAKGFFNKNGDWAKYIESKGASPWTGYYPRLTGLLNNYILPEWGPIALEHITSAGLDKWLQSLKSVRTGRPLSADTKNHVISALNSIFKYAVYQEIIQKNPAAEIRPFRGGETRPVFSREEIRQLFPNDKAEMNRIWPNPIWRCFFLVLRDTGLRTGEALALDWANYSPEFQAFAIVQKYEACSGKILPGTKTGRPRAVSVTNKTAKVLKELPQRPGLIFSQDGKKAYSEHNVCDRLRDALEKAGIPRYIDGKARTPYSFRHSFVTNALSAALDPDEVALLAGHSRQVQKGYNHPTNHHLFNKIRHLREHVEKLYSS